MALTICRECKREVSTEAQTCPNCGVTNPGGRAVKATVSSKRNLGCIGLGVICVILFAISQRMDEQRDANDPAKAARDSTFRFQNAARVACKSAIANQLKSPKSADFSNTQSGPAAEDSTKYRVKGQVTAVNSFNAPLTNDYQCDLTRDGQLLTAKILER